MQQYEKLLEAADHISGLADTPIDIGIITGTGVSLEALPLEEAVSISYQDIPNCVAPSAPSHSGRLTIGKLAGKLVALFQGRFHYYEGLSMDEVVFPIRLLSLLKCRSVVLINASGSVNEKLAAGDLVAVTDHINMMGSNPLIGSNEERFGTRFPDMSKAYCSELRKVLHAAADATGLKLKEGIYLALTGPSLETRAEYTMISRLGSDLVGMSTVPEVIAARHSGLNVAVISIVTNCAAPDKPLKKTTVEEVIEIAHSASDRLVQLLKTFIEKY